ncbi:MAG TPA: TetR/AcrR family transcriptional regulator [Symbiobacteriaceae bacterium]|nr:TetR/AcrR family transcriptional regulator [Symbiobacteriaceae bacterium]
MNILDGFQRRTERKKEQILQAALELFGSKGMKAVSMAEIAEKAGVSPVSIYTYFGSKANVARQIVFSLFEGSVDEMEQLLASDLPFVQKLQTVMAKNIEAAESVSFAQLDQAAFFGDPEFMGFLNEFTETRTVPFLLRLMEQGQQEGAINPELSTEAVLLYVKMFRSVLESDMSMKLRHDLGHLFFYGLLGSPPNNRE